MSHSSRVAAARRARIAVLATLVALLSALTAASARADLPVVYHFPTALAAGTIAPNADPLGANDWSCRPSRAHPRPVDVVGHSQGGMMPRYYIKHLGGDATVNALVGLTSSNHGTTLSGLSTFGRLIPPVSGILEAGAPALEQQRLGSDFNSGLDAGGDTISPVRYTVIASQYDEVVTPYTNSYLSGATNVKLQSGCIINFTEHLGIAYDRRALRLTLNALDPSTARTPPCVPTTPISGG